MYCMTCGGGRTVVRQELNGCTKEICDYCKGSGLADEIKLMAGQVGYGEKEDKELILFEIEGFPEEWLETGVRVMVKNQRLYLRLGRRIIDGQPKDNRLAASKREFPQKD